MSRGKPPQIPTVVGRRIRLLREECGWSQEKLGVAIGIDESSARARISRYEALRRFHTVDIRVAEAGAGTLA